MNSTQPATSSAHDVACAEAGKSSEITLQIASGVLRGTLQLPAGCGPVPIALVIAGSGATDRDGNQLPSVHDDAYKLLAAALAQVGVATLRYDKRGVAGSAKAVTSEADLRFEDYVNDAVAWLNQLQQDTRFSQRIVIGHSEGSLIGMLAVQHTPSAAFISLSGPGRNAADVLRAQLRTKLTGAMLKTVEQVITELSAGRQVAGINPADALFRPSVQPYLISWFKYDPASEIARLSLPMLLAQGTLDEQVGSEDLQLLAAANPAANALSIEGMCHTLKHITDSDADRARCYTDPELALSAQLVTEIGEFIRKLDMPQRIVP